MANDDKTNGPPTQPTAASNMQLTPVNLPDFKPKGMSPLDKALAWAMAFIIVITLVVFAFKYVDSHTATNTAAPKATATAKPNPVAAVPSTMYVIVNTATKYVWWLDNGGAPFTVASAKAFIVGHPTYKIFSLKLS